MGGEDWALKHIILDIKSFAISIVLFVFCYVHRCDYSHWVKRLLVPPNPFAIGCWGFLVNDSYFTKKNAHII